MKGPLRKTMTWLHTWSGLILGWVLFAVFLTGTIAFFQTEVTHWMQPEVHVSTPSEKSALVAYQYLEQQAPFAEQWDIDLPDARERTLGVSWKMPGQEQERRRGPMKLLDASTGEEITPRDTRGGAFPYRFHFQLHYLPWQVGRLIVTVATMMMFVAIVSGIIMHRKIFVDFFTFSRRKQAVGWLDAHTLTSVLALPFHIMITFSGLILLSSSLLFWNAGERGHRGNGGVEEPAGYETRIAAPQPPLQNIIASASQELQTSIGRIQIENPMRQDAVIRMTPSLRDKLSGGRGGSKSATYDNDGQLTDTTETTGSSSAIAAVGGTLHALHEARFSDVLTRWLFFIAGVMGTVMVASGSILWVVKRAKSQLGQFGFELVSGLNVGCIAGLCCATASYFWANRLIPIDIASRAEWEIHVFFIVWLLTVVHGLFFRHKQGWIMQLSLGGLLFLLIPVLDSLTSDVSLTGAWLTGDWIRLSFDVVSVLTGVTLFITAYYVSQVKERKPKQSASVVVPKHRSQEHRSQEVIG